MGAKDWGLVEYECHRKRRHRNCSRKFNKCGENSGGSFYLVLNTTDFLSNSELKTVRILNYETNMVKTFLETLLGALLERKSGRLFTDAGHFAASNSPCAQHGRRTCTYPSMSSSATARHFRDCSPESHWNSTSQETIFPKRSAR